MASILVQFEIQKHDTSAYALFLRIALATKLVHL